MLHTLKVNCERFRVAQMWDVVRRCFASPWWGSIQPLQFLDMRHCFCHTDELLVRPTPEQNRDCLNFYVKLYLGSDWYISKQLPLNKKNEKQKCAVMLWCSFIPSPVVHKQKQNCLFFLLQKLFNRNYIARRYQVFFHVNNKVYNVFLKVTLTQNQHATGKKS